MGQILDDDLVLGSRARSPVFHDHPENMFRGTSSRSHVWRSGQDSAAEPRFLKAICEVQLKGE